MTSYFLDINVIQQLPPSNVNRDDTGAPKTAIYGGVNRARVSSQAWKRAARQGMRDHLDVSDQGVRTRRAIELLADRVTELDINMAREDALKKAAELLKSLGLKVKTPRKTQDDEQSPDQIEYLVLFSNHQLDRMAQLILDSGDKIAKKDAVQAAKIGQGVDLALFGRMVADATELNVDASVQVSHAISTHAVEQEADYFTAVDDVKEEGDDAGAGMIGTIGFNSSTLYRFATVDLSELLNNMGDMAATARAARAFAESFVLSMPTGKQNTFANNTVPDAVLVSLRRGRSVSLVGAFENPVTGEDGGFVKESCTRLAEYDRSVQDNFVGTPVISVLTRTEAAGPALDAVAERLSLNELLDRVETEISAVLEDVS
ncbi:type I-E CRISPR-associated protein Cas7/Cse4/CasC [Propionibacterium australiense]|uniref:CasC_Cse4: CRISPR-associated protein Cas7/Cse4/CasC, subtype I-E/ECOLI n=1 Tax=Propionibacterium australiense TaxID=119981 RepID=A0A383S961_9ACTN|nr:type I-E CRISPR-associated protein Cas7/Cse4/CasC [Propionibacterium australiense]RLP07479.1 type I-E CRISPR-associated protein Cas7/Cse4/CasC [Propionibacterium australiense]SYZ34082.1 casC_Cse4: CRISPR-associated protein Cas7/Cse4/CasC, subtype I-E/ECOLI [Propionibacterium australiense]